MQNDELLVRLQKLVQIQKLQLIVLVTKMAQRSKPKQQKKVVDATVIDEEILKKAVRDYLSQNKIIPKEPQINFGKIKVLSLSFLNILKIQYLDALVRLEKLQLDNNIIEKIEGINHLVNLKWLDLSFNRIKTIEGLEKLVNLTDLSLYNNKVMVLDGLHNCTKLNIFSIGNNLIRSFEQVHAYFGQSADKKTRFKYLQVLNVYGNPFTIKDNEKDKEYEAHLIAKLPNLRYLDYIYIDERKRKEITESDQKFRNNPDLDQGTFLRNLKLEEEKQQEQLEEERKKLSAKMHLLDNFQKDLVKIEDLEKIQKMRGLEEEINNFMNKVKELVDTMQKKIKDQNQKKLQEIRKSEQKLRLREKQAERRSLEAIQSFEKDHKVLLKIFQNRSISKNWKEEAVKLRTKILELKDTLLNIEVELMQDAQNLFKKQIILSIEQSNKRIQIILSQQQKDEKNEETGFFKKIEDEIKEFNTQLERISRDEIDRYTSLQNAGESETEYSNDPDLNSLLQNKQTIPGTVATVKEVLLQRKGKKESEIDNQLCSKDREAYKKQYEERQYERNRKNVKNINEKVQELLRELVKLTAYEHDDD